MGDLTDITIEYPGTETPFWIVEVSQIFDDTAAVKFLSDGNKVSVNGEIMPEFEDAKLKKRWLYLALSRMTGYSSPWGCLTGIRPAKLIHVMHDSGMSEEQIREEFGHFYCVSPDKTELAIETAKVQAPFLHGVNPGVVDWYANMPFCPSRCLYCSFTSNSIVKYKKSVDAYLDAMERELAAASEIFGKMSACSETLYLGGGTPTSLNEIQFARYISMFGKYIDVKGLKEFSLEAGRPDSITPAKLEAAARAGVTRISINPQTMNDITLRRIGRAHTADQTVQAFKLAREAGFNNINMDVIAGLPFETVDMFQYTMEKIAELNPEGMTVHTLSIKRAADLKRDDESRASLSTDATGKMVHMGRMYAGKMLMRPFYMYRQKHMLGNHENVSYCKPGFESPYNIHIMEEDRTIFGIGAGAVTKAVFPDGRIERAFNVKSVEYYLERLPEMIERKRKLLL